MGVIYEKPFIAESKVKKVLVTSHSVVQEPDKGRYEYEVTIYNTGENWEFPDERFWTTRIKTSDDVKACVLTEEGVQGDIYCLLPPGDMPLQVVVGEFNSADLRVDLDTGGLWQILYVLRPEHDQCICLQYLLLPPMVQAGGSVSRFN